MSGWGSVDAACNLAILLVWWLVFGKYVHWSGVGYFLKDVMALEMYEYRHSLKFFMIAFGDVGIFKTIYLYSLSYDIWIMKDDYLFLKIILAANLFINYIQQIFAV